MLFPSLALMIPALGSSYQLPFWPFPGDSLTIDTSRVSIPFHTCGGLDEPQPPSCLDLLPELHPCVHVPSSAHPMGTSFPCVLNGNLLFQFQLLLFLTSHHLSEFYSRYLLYPQHSGSLPATSPKFFSILFTSTDKGLSETQPGWHPLFTKVPLMAS